VLLFLGRFTDNADRHPTDPPVSVSHPAAATKLYLQLLTSGEPLAVVNPATGQFHLLKLPTAGGDWLDRLEWTGGRLVWEATGGTYAIDDDLEGRPQRIAPWYFVPSTTPGRLWFVFGKHDRTSPHHLHTWAVERTVRGRTIRRVRIAPPRCAVVAAVDRALLCQPRSDALLAIDPATGHSFARIRGAFPLATHGNVVASCDDPCRAIQVTDVARGQHASVIAPRGARFVGGYDGAISPDGALLAVPVATPNHDSLAGPPGSLQVGLIDVKRRSARVLPGSRLAADYRKLAWSSRGQLFFAAGRGRLMTYERGWAKAGPLSVDVRAPMLDLAAS
jgi:hypothetical protein